MCYIYFGRWLPGQGRIERNSEGEYGIAKASYHGPKHWEFIGWPFAGPVGETTGCRFVQIRSAAFWNKSSRVFIGFEWFYIVLMGFGYSDIQNQSVESKMFKVTELAKETF